MILFIGCNLLAPARLVHRRECASIEMIGQSADAVKERTRLYRGDVERWIWRWSPALEEQALSLIGRQPWMKWWRNRNRSFDMCRPPRCQSTVNIYGKQIGLARPEWKLTRSIAWNSSRSPRAIYAFRQVGENDRARARRWIIDANANDSLEERKRRKLGGERKQRTVNVRVNAAWSCVCFIVRTISSLIVALIVNYFSQMPRKMMVDAAFPLVEINARARARAREKRIDMRDRPSGIVEPMRDRLFNVALKTGKVERLS